jgi:hypothetical protein
LRPFGTFAFSGYFTGNSYGDILLGRGRPASAALIEADKRVFVVDSRPKRMAEREGFEPSIEFPLYTLSKRAPSTTRPSLRDGKLVVLWVFIQNSMARAGGTGAGSLTPKRQTPGSGSRS